MSLFAFFGSNFGFGTDDSAGAGADPAGDWAAGGFGLGVDVIEARGSSDFLKSAFTGFSFAAAL
jgi:hypothetical protein